MPHDCFTESQSKPQNHFSILHASLNPWRVLAAWACPTLWDPIEGSLPGSSVHGILQARILEWAAMPFTKGSSWSQDRTQVSHIAGGFFTNWATREAYNIWNFKKSLQVLICKDLNKIQYLSWFRVLILNKNKVINSFGGFSLTGNVQKESKMYGQRGVWIP